MAYRHILVPFDGSPLAKAAVSVAAWLAWRGGGELDLVKAVGEHPPFSVMPLAGMADPDEQLAHEETEMSYQAARLREKGVSATGAAVPGEPSEVLLDHIRRRGIDLVVMGTHGRPLAERWLLGSVASDVAHRSPVPVLLVPRNARPTHDDALQVLVAMDESADAEAALEAAIQFQQTVPAELTVFEVFPPNGTDSGTKSLDWYDTPVLGDSGYLDQVQAQLRDRDLNVRRAYSMGIAGEEIVRFAERAPFDLVAIGTRGLTGLPRLVWGSVADYVVRHAGVPVLVTSQLAARARTTIEPELLKQPAR